MSEDYTTMPDEQLAQTVADGTAEIERRATIRDAARRTDQMCLDYLRAAGRTNGGPFEAPVGFIGAYPRGWRVTQDGGTYEATAPGTVTAPPSDGWTEVPEGEPLVEFWEDREYDQGEQARDAGRIWTATSAVQGARPSEYPGGWAPSD